MIVSAVTSTVRSIRDTHWIRAKPATGLLAARLPVARAGKSPQFTQLLSINFQPDGGGVGLWRAGVTAVCGRQTTPRRRGGNYTYFGPALEETLAGLQPVADR